ncbi:MAG: NAD-dependent epimerase/dehydratase family protein [Sandaracinaceae bacterium]|nr:NAD-dependent epimerase/dehydratase family protein [Sandaracinaceae bacterium]
MRSFSRGRYPELDALGVEHARGDLADRAAVRRAAEGCDAVVHTAAKAGVWGSPLEYRRANVIGTENVLAACVAASIPRLVYTSTPSVVHQGGDIEGGDESLPYTAHASTAYQATKTEAEKLVLAAQSRALSVVALRPHLVWGPGDPHLVPRILARGRRGRVALPGGGAARVDTVYVDNAADAHVAALERLAPDAACAGRAYFVTNGEPRPLRDIVLGILRAGGVEARVVSIPPRVAHAAGALLEAAFRLSRAPSASRRSRASSPSSSPPRTGSTSAPRAATSAGRPPSRSTRASSACAPRSAPAAELALELRDRLPVLRAPDPEQVDRGDHQAGRTEHGVERGGGPPDPVGGAGREDEREEQRHPPPVALEDLRLAVEALDLLLDQRATIRHGRVFRSSARPVKRPWTAAAICRRMAAPWESKDRILYVQILAQMLIADGVLADEERSYLDRIMDSLGMPPRSASRRSPT